MLWLLLLLVRFDLCNKHKMCYFDEVRKIWIHIFEIHEFRCKCRKKVVRQPIKKENKGSIFDEY